MSLHSCVFTQNYGPTSGTKSGYHPPPCYSSIENYLRGPAYANCRWCQCSKRYASTHSIPQRHGQRIKVRPMERTSCNSSSVIHTMKQTCWTRLNWSYSHSFVGVNIYNIGRRGGNKGRCGGGRSTVPYYCTPNLEKEDNHLFFCSNGALYDRYPNHRKGTNWWKTH